MAAVNAWDNWTQSALIPDPKISSAETFGVLEGLDTRLKAAEAVIEAEPWVI